MDFAKATRAAGVDGHFEASNRRVTVKPTELPAPLFPGDTGFWKEFRQVVQQVCIAHDGGLLDRGVNRAILAHTGGDAQVCAELVHRDMPTEIMSIAFRGIQTKAWRHFTGLEGVFTDRVVLLDHLMGWAAHAVSPNSFCAKWHFMLARPEEVAAAVLRGDLSAPDDVTLLLNSCFDAGQIVADPASFTRYPEGCPGHPSYNAMHSAAAGAICAVIRVMMELDPVDAADIELAARNMAYFRTLAGVHYPQDNAMGLWLGQETVRRLLPNKLAELGVPRAEVQAAFDAVEIDWLM